MPGHPDRASSLHQQKYSPDYVTRSHCALFSLFSSYSLGKTWLSIVNRDYIKVLSHSEYCCRSGKPPFYNTVHTPSPLPSHVSKGVYRKLIDCSFKAGRASLYIYIVFACLSRTVHDACSNNRDLISTSLSPSELIPSAEGPTQVFLQVVPASGCPNLTASNSIFFYSPCPGTLYYASVPV